MRIDHVIYGTGDLGAAATWFADEFALPVVLGGRHDGLGTHNRLVLLGDGSFIELLAVADREEAMRSPLGAALCSAVERGDGLLGWAVAVDDVAALASRLGTSLCAVGRQGMVARLTGVAEALAEPCLPFFIERSADWRRGSVAPATAGLSWIEVAGDAARLKRWLGGARLPVRVVDGAPGVCAIGIGNRELRPR
jgi:catechol 2,3-dioxygenase-like lactoylglutathione lyase family enzyme